VTAMGSSFKPGPRFLLPVMIFLGVLVVGLRGMDAWDMVATGRVFETVKSSQAASEKEEPVINPPTMQTPSQAAKEEDKTAPTGQRASPSIAPKAEDDSTGMETELIKQLAERRDQLEKRNKSLDSREALIKVAELRIDQKMKEMETLRAQLQTMVNQLSAAQQTQIDNLVKIYETMKPKEAARIFETLELPILLGVVQRMKPARTAAVMAEMNPEKAKEITVALTKQDQLPSIK